MTARPVSGVEILILAADRNGYANVRKAIVGIVEELRASHRLGLFGDPAGSQDDLALSAHTRHLEVPYTHPFAVAHRFSDAGWAAAERLIQDRVVAQARKWHLQVIIQPATSDDPKKTVVARLGELSSRPAAQSA